MVGSCNGKKEKTIVIDFNSPTQDSTLISFHEDEAVHVAIASISSPRESFRFYNELLEYISTKINLPIHTVQKQSYEEVNQLLRDGVVDFAFICSGAYIDIEATEEVDLMVGPVIEGQKHFHGYLITNGQHHINNFADLRNHSFAFSDPLSHTGYTYPLAILKQMNETPDHFFSKTLFSFGHDLSIEMVNREIVDAAFVHGQIYDQLRSFSPEKLSNTSIVEISPPFAVPPVVSPKQLDRKRFRQYQEIFLNLHNERKGREILEKLNIDRFEKLDDRIYDPVREIKNSI